MQIQLGLITYDGCELLGQVSRSTSGTPGLTTLSLSIELPINVILPQTPQLITCILSENTSSPVKWFTGFYLGATAKPVNNNQAFMWTFDIVDVLYYLANSKQVNVYANSTTLKAHAQDIAALAERPATPGAYRYIDINVLPTDTDPFPFAIENNSFSLQTALAELSKQTGYEIIVQDPGWLNHESLFASTNAITRIAFRDPLANQQLAPVPLAIYDPTNPDFCDEFPFTDFTFGFHTEGITSAQTIGKNGAKAKQDGETIITSYAKTRSFPIKKPQTDPNVPNFEFAFELSADINKLNFVAIQPSLGKIEVITPYDPNTPLTTKKCYFDRESNPPRVVFFQDDILGLTVDNTCYAQENFQFINVIETDTGASNALSSATHGAISTAYKTINDPSIGDFGIARDVAQASLKEGKKGFFCSGKRESTTENWLNGGLMRVQIPSQGIDKWVKVVSTNGSIQGKITENNELRDLINYSSITFSEVDKNVFNSNSFGRMARGANNQGFPTYDDKPFITTPTPTLCPIFTVTGSSSGDYNQYQIVTNHPNYSVLGVAGLSTETRFNEPLNKAGEATFLINLTDVTNYSNVSTLSLNIASIIGVGFDLNDVKVGFERFEVTNVFPNSLVIRPFEPGLGDLEFEYVESNTTWFNNTAVSTATATFPEQASFAPGSILRLFFRYRTKAEGGGANGTYARTELLVTFCGQTLVSDFGQVESDGTQSGNQETNDIWLDIPADAFLGTDQVLTITNLVHKPSSGYGITATFDLFDCYLVFPDPTVTLTHKVFFRGTQIADLSFPGESTSAFQPIDLAPYVGEEVEVKLMSTLTSDFTGDFTAAANSSVSINCSDINGPGGGGS